MKRLKVRMRPDLVLERHSAGSGRYWVVKDPLTLNYFRLRDEECLVLRLLDGQTTFDHIRQEFERAFAPLRLGAQQLQAFILRLHELGLTMADAPGQGDVLRARSLLRQRRLLWGTIANPLAVRLPGMPARPLLNCLYPKLRCVFHPLALALAAALVISAGGLILIEFGAVQDRLLDFQSLFSAQGAMWLLVVLIGVKIIHELAHALTCRHFGGQCHELGVLLLLFSPTLYCDVSDAWRIESRRRRMLVSAAGMLVELVIAALATWIWWFSAPGFLQMLCLRVIFVCSIGTFLFNANPLLRCDGYYILSDLIDLPNLWQESRLALRRFMSRHLLGLELPGDPTIAPRMETFLVGYAIASIVYLWLLIAGILWFWWGLLEPRGLSAVATALMLIVVAGMVGTPAYQTLRFYASPGMWRRAKKGRARTTLLIAAALLLAIVVIPLPRRIDAPLWLEAEGAQPVYVSVAGQLQEAVEPGVTVEKGQVLARLESSEVEHQIRDLSSEVARQELRLKHLKLLQSDDPIAAAQIPSAGRSLEDYQSRLEQWRSDQARLTLRAPVAGVVLPPPALHSPPEQQERLPGWQGTPLDSWNRGCHLEIGSLVCLVGNPQRLEAMLVIDEALIADVRVGQQVRVKIAQGPVRVLSGIITELARADSQDLPAGLAQAFDLPQKSTTAVQAPAATYYQARVKLDEQAAPLLVGMLGEGTILTDWQPLGVRVWRYLQRTFGG